MKSGDKLVVKVDGKETEVTVGDEIAWMPEFLENHDESSWVVAGEGNPIICTNTTIAETPCVRCFGEAKVGHHGIRDGQVYDEYWCEECYAKEKR